MEGVRTVDNDGVHPCGQEGSVEDVGLEFATLSDSAGHNSCGGGGELQSARPVQSPVPFPCTCGGAAPPPNC